MIIEEENENQILKNRIAEKSKWKISKSKKFKCKIKSRSQRIDSSFCLRGCEFIALSDPAVVLNDHWRIKWKSKIQKTNFEKIKVEKLEGEKVSVKLGSETKTGEM